MLFCIALVFFIIALIAFPPTPFFWVLRILMIPACLLGMVIFITGIITSRYDAVLDREGIEFGTFLGKRRFKWAEIKSVLVINAMTGKEVCLEFKNQPQPNDSGKPPFKRLPDTYGMEADELAKTLVRWQHEYGNANSN